MQTLEQVFDSIPFRWAVGIGLATFLTCPIWGSILARHFGLM